MLQAIATSIVLQCFYCIHTFAMLCATWNSNVSETLPGILPGNVAGTLLAISTDDITAMLMMCMFAVLQQYWIGNVAETQLGEQQVAAFLQRWQ